MRKKKLYKREVYKTRAEWLDSRGFGGSSASAILGKNPYMTELDLINTALRKDRTPKRDTVTESTQYGVQCEPLIRKIYAIDMKNKYKVHNPYFNEMYRRIDKPFLTATLDGVLTEIATKRKGILEIKTHDIRNKKDEAVWENGLPDNYYIQLLHYLMVMNDFEFAVLVAKLRFFDYFDPEGKKLIRTEMRYYYIDRKEKETEIKYLENKETKFYQDYIVDGKIPPIKITF